MRLRASRWRVFRKPLLLQPKSATCVSLAALTLQNWLRTETEAGHIYLPFEPQEDGAPPSGDTNAWLDLEEFGHHNATQEAKNIRKEFTEYVMNEGVVPWQ